RGITDRVRLVGRRPQVVDAVAVRREDVRTTKGWEAASQGRRGWDRYRWRNVRAALVAAGHAIRTRTSRDLDRARGGAAGHPEIGGRRVATRTIPGERGGGRAEAVAPCGHGS